MKVLFSIPYYAPAYSYGGPVAASEMMAEGLSEKGVDIDVITTDVLDAENRNNVLQEKLNGVNVYRFKNISNTLAKQANLYAPRGLKVWLKSNIKNYDLVHFHDVFAFLMTMPVMDCASANDVPFIVQPHGTTNYEHIENSGVLKPIKVFLLNKYLKRFPKAAAFIALSETEKKAVSRYYKPENIEVIPNGIQLPDFDNIDPTAVKSRFNLDKRTKLIVFLGRLHSIKGIDRSLKILSAVENTDFHFAVIGPDEQNEKTKLTSLAEKLGIADKVSFTGPVYGEDKYKYLKAADLFMLLSRAEGHPVTCIEALACGTPVFVSGPAGLKEFETYNAGVITDAEATKKSAKALSRLLNNQEELNRMEINALKIVKELFTKEKMINRIYDLYSGII